MLCRCCHGHVGSVTVMWNTFGMLVQEFEEDVGLAALVASKVLWSLYNMGELFRTELFPKMTFYVKASWLSRPCHGRFYACIWSWREIYYWESALQGLWWILDLNAWLGVSLLHTSQWTLQSRSQILIPATVTAASVLYMFASVESRWSYSLGQTILGSCFIYP